MFTLKAFRNSSKFLQTFTNHEALQDKMKWLVANGFTIETGTRAQFPKNSAEVH